VGRALNKANMHPSVYPCPQIRNGTPSFRAEVTIVLWLPHRTQKGNSNSILEVEPIGQHGQNVLEVEKLTLSVVHSNNSYNSASFPNDIINNYKEAGSYWFRRLMLVLLLPWEAPHPPLAHHRTLSHLNQFSWILLYIRKILNKHIVCHNYITF